MTLRYVKQFLKSEFNKIIQSIYSEEILSSDLYQLTIYNEQSTAPIYKV